MANFRDMPVYVLIGILLGMCNYLLLWATVQRLPVARRPMLLSVMSFYARTAIVLVVLFLTTGSRPENIISSLIGFFFIRACFVRYLGPKRGRRIAEGGVGA